MGKLEFNRKTFPAYMSLLTPSANETGLLFRNPDSSADGATWINSSDRNLKEGFALADKREVLAAIQELNQKLTEALRRRDAENAELKRRLDDLEQGLNSLSHSDEKPVSRKPAG